MAYEKTIWKDQDVENPRTYSVRQNLDGTVTLLDAFGEITEIGTPVNADNMNKIEEGIANSIDKTDIIKGNDIATSNDETVPSTSNVDSRIINIMSRYKKIKYNVSGDTINLVTISYNFTNTLNPTWNYTFPTPFTKDYVCMAIGGLNENSASCYWLKNKTLTGITIRAFGRVDSDRLNHLELMAIGV